MSKQRLAEAMDQCRRLLEKADEYKRRYMVELAAMEHVYHNFRYSEGANPYLGVEREWYDQAYQEGLERKELA